MKKIEQIREIAKSHDDANQFAKELANKGLIVSMAEGRRLWYGMKKEKSNTN